MMDRAYYDDVATIKTIFRRYEEMNYAKQFFKKSWISALSLSIIGASAAVVFAGGVAVQAAQTDKVTNVPTKAPIVSSVKITNSTSSSQQGAFAFVDPESIKSGNENVYRVARTSAPTEKDLTQEQAANIMAAKILELTNADLSSYTVLMQFGPAMGKDIWFGSFTSADGKTVYNCQIDSVTGKVLAVTQFSALPGDGNAKESLPNTFDPSTNLLYIAE